jgi:hypothetical protein
LSNDPRRPAALAQTTAQDGRTDSDVAPRPQVSSGVAPRIGSGLRAAVQIPRASPPPLDLTPHDLLEEGWDAPRSDADDEEDPDDGEATRLNSISVPEALIAQARAVSDPVEAARSSADVTAQMPLSPVASRLDDLYDVASPPSSAPLPSSPIFLDARHMAKTLPGRRVPTSQPVRRAFLASVASNDPPAQRLVSVALASFLATLAISAFVVWTIHLIRH